MTPPTLSPSTTGPAPTAGMDLDEVAQNMARCVDHPDGRLGLTLDRCLRDLDVDGFARGVDKVVQRMAASTHGIPFGDGNPPWPWAERMERMAHALCNVGGALSADQERSTTIMLQRLLDAGVDDRTTDAQGRTLLDRAQAHQHHQMSALLEARVLRCSEGQKDLFLPRPRARSRL